MAKGTELVIKEEEKLKGAETEWKSLEYFIIRKEEGVGGGEPVYIPTKCLQTNSGPNTQPSQHDLVKSPS